jgi:hypothetical protein
MIINNIPRSLVELYPLIDDIEGRFNEEEINSIMSIIESYLW